MSFDFDMTLQQLIAFISTQKLIISIVLLLLLTIVKRLLLRKIEKRSKRKGEDRRNQITILDQLANAMIFISLLLVWSSEIQSLAISIAAFMVAIVLATKEFIQCFIGFIYYLGARPFRVGEWIEMKGIVGEVVDMDWAKTALLEVDPETFSYTGKHVYVPNSHLVTQSVRNLNFMRRYRIHSFEIINEPVASPYPLLPVFKNRAAKHCEFFKDVAERYKGLIERHLEQEFISIKPYVEITTNEFAKLIVRVSLFCPTDEAYRLEQVITKEWMALWFKQIGHQTLPLNRAVS